MAQKWAKIMASLALIWIIISIIWTWIQVIIWNNKNTSEVKLTPEQTLQIQEMQEIINSQSWSITSTWETSWTGNTIETNN